MEPIGPPAFIQPEYALGALDVFATPAEFRAQLLMEGVANINANRVALALLTATRIVLRGMGYAFTDTELPPDPAELTVTVVAVRAQWRSAVLAQAVRDYKSAEIPFGTLSGWDMATYVRAQVPEVDRLLTGERVAFGIA